MASSGIAFTHIRTTENKTSLFLRKGLCVGWVVLGSSVCFLFGARASRCSPGWPCRPELNSLLFMKPVSIHRSLPFAFIQLRNRVPTPEPAKLSFFPCSPFSFSDVLGSGTSIPTAPCPAFPRPGGPSHLLSPSRFPGYWEAQENQPTVQTGATPDLWSLTSAWPPGPSGQPLF